MAGMTCDVCNGKVVASAKEGWFVCEYCDTEYPLEWMKAKFQKTQTIKVEGPVTVEGVENADTLYNRALDWLNLQDNGKAIEVLEVMVNQYPGDKRGWSKLARLKPEKRSIDNAVRLGDTALFEEWQTAAEAACIEVRNGQGEKWVNGNAFVLASDNRYNSFPSVKALLEEGNENAEFFKEFCSTIKNSPIFKNYINALRFLLDQPLSYPSTPTTIIGNLVGYYNSYYHRYDYGVANQIITKSTIQQTTNIISNMQKNKLCPKCGNPLIRKKPSKYDHFYGKCYCPQCDHCFEWK